LYALTEKQVAGELIGIDHLQLVFIGQTRCNEEMVSMPKSRSNPAVETAG
jgi:hypothetical protein